MKHDIKELISISKALSNHRSSPLSVFLLSFKMTYLILIIPLKMILIISKSVMRKL